MSMRPAHDRGLSALLTLVLLQFLVGQRTAADAAKQLPWGSQPAAQSASRPPQSLKPPLYFEVRANVKGATHGPFVPDITLHPGAQISLQARTSSAAHVYMLHCDANAVLSVFPDAGGIPFLADQWVTLPAAGMPIKLGPQAGTETIYMLATRDTLARSDGRLEHWLTERLRQPQTARCDGELEALLAGATDTTGLPPTAATAHPRKLPYALRGVDISKPNGPARAFAQNDGVVILRLSYRNAP